MAVANLSNADTNVARDRPLAAQSAIPQKQLDTDLATQAAKQSSIGRLRSATCPGRVEPVLDEGLSPIEGIAGLTTAQVGNLVGTTTTMTTVSQVNPIWAYFNISESDYLTEARRFSHD